MGSAAQPLIDLRDKAVEWSNKIASMLDKPAGKTDTSPKPLAKDDLGWYARPQKVATKAVQPAKRVQQRTAPLANKRTGRKRSQ